MAVKSREEGTSANNRHWLVATDKEVGKLLDKTYLLGLLKTRLGHEPSPEEYSTCYGEDWRNSLVYRNKLVTGVLAKLHKEYAENPAACANPKLAATIKRFLQHEYSILLFAGILENDAYSQRELGNQLLNVLLHKCNTTANLPSVSVEDLLDSVQIGWSKLVSTVVKQKIRQPEQLCSFIWGQARWAIHDIRSLPTYESLDAHLGSPTSELPPTTLLELLSIEPKGQDFRRLNRLEAQQVMLTGLITAVHSGEFRKIEFIILLLSDYHPLEKYEGLSGRAAICRWLQVWQTNPAILEQYLRQNMLLSRKAAKLFSDFLVEAHQEIVGRDLNDSSWIGNFLYQTKTKLRRKWHRYFGDYFDFDSDMD